MAGNHLQGHLLSCPSWYKKEKFIDPRQRFSREPDQIGHSDVRPGEIHKGVGIENRTGFTEVAASEHSGARIIADADAFSGVGAPKDADVICIDIKSEILAKGIAVINDHAEIIDTATDVQAVAKGVG